ncbi:MAG TPA: polysaccharide biosynthesis/export family protein [Candidatus Hydrogenedentes bacterium]|nr:polysaccharide biosynthesis/export family protein [Candidatus Hydrogenedentota bacterium]HQH51590.1 polysaccharide biosynthesis/export family protein [Candidatus Hydrogenedentota bacterium]
MRCAERRSVAGIVAVLFLAVLCGCQTPTGIRVIDPKGKTRELTPEEVDQMSGAPEPYLLQVGDQLQLLFNVRNIQEDEAAWDYKIEVGDNMEVRLSSDTTEPGIYLIDYGDVIGISFLNNWPMNMNRTVRPDGKISATEIGDVQAAGLTTRQLEDKLTALYEKTGIMQGDPQISVNVDFANVDRLESISRDVTVRPNGAISLPMLENEVRIAGLTVADASQAIAGEAAKVLKNPPTVGLVVFPNINTVLSGMNSVTKVRTDGRISVPRIDYELQAAGYGVDELRDMLKEACKGLIYNPVDVSVDVLQATGARIYVGGEVGMPGVYPLDSCPTALQALIMARGPVNSGRLNSIIVVRRNPEGKPYVFKTNLRAALSKGYTDNDIPLKPFDIVFVPEKLVVRANIFVERYIDRIVPFDNSLGVSGTYYMNEQQVNTKSRNIGATAVFTPLQTGAIVVSP